MSKGKKRSRSRSRSSERKKEKLQDELKSMKKQMDNLTRVVRQLVDVQLSQADKDKNKDQNEREKSPEAAEDTQSSVITETPDEEDKGETTESSVSSKDNKEEDSVKKDESNKENKVNEEILRTLGEDPDASAKSLQKYHPEIKSRWTKWTREGLPEKAKKEILEKYPRAGEILLEAPKVNLGVPMTEVATKRDKHFIELQNTVGSAIAAQATAISMMLETAPGEEVDQESFCELLSHAGQLLTDTFYQLSVTRKSFITPLMDKVYKTSLEEAKSDAWLYGEKFTDQVKEIKILEKTSTNLKPAAKKVTPPKSSGNGKYPPARSKQVGSSQWKKPTFKFSRKGTYPQNQSGPKSSSRPASHTSSRK